MRNKKAILIGIALALAVPAITAAVSWGTGKYNNRYFVKSFGTNTKVVDQAEYTVGRTDTVLLAHYASDEQIFYFGLPSDYSVEYSDMTPIFWVVDDGNNGNRTGLPIIFQGTNGATMMNGDDYSLECNNCAAMVTVNPSNSNDWLVSAITDPGALPQSVADLSGGIPQLTGSKDLEDLTTKPIDDLDSISIVDNTIYHDTYNGFGLLGATWTSGSSIISGGQGIFNINTSTDQTFTLGPDSFFGDQPQDDSPLLFVCDSDLSNGNKHAIDPFTGETINGLELFRVPDNGCVLLVWGSNVDTHAFSTHPYDWEMPLGKFCLQNDCSGGVNQLTYSTTYEFDDSNVSAGFSFAGTDYYDNIYGAGNYCLGIRASASVSPTVGGNWNFAVYDPYAETSLITDSDIFTTTSTDPYVVQTHEFSCDLPGDGFSTTGRSYTFSVRCPDGADDICYSRGPWEFFIYPNQ